MQVERAQVERRALRLKDVEWQRGANETVWLEVNLNPLLSGDRDLLGISVVFHDVSAANRQLESAYEELQSAKEELETMNEMLRERSLELDEVNNLLESILTSLRSGVIVVDVEMRITVWNQGAEELWGVRKAEADGQHLLNLDIGLPLAELRPMVPDRVS